MMDSRKYNPQPNSQRLPEMKIRFWSFLVSDGVLQMSTVHFWTIPRKTCAAQMARRASIAQRDFHFRG
jgi:hypothetical protein